MNIMKYRKIWFGISLAFIVPGVVALVLWGLNLASTLLVVARLR